MAARSLPFEIWGEPLSLIQYVMGRDFHLGVCPSDAVMRVYAAALAQKRRMMKIIPYFFKVSDSDNYEFDF